MLCRHSGIRMQLPNADIIILIIYIFYKEYLLHPYTFIYILYLFYMIICVFPRFPLYSACVCDNNDIFQITDIMYKSPSGFLSVGFCYCGCSSASDIQGPCRDFCFWNLAYFPPNSLDSMVLYH